MSSEIHARADQQDGAVAVVVAICLLALVSIGALAVDLGSAWETKRDFVADTDAAALAAAVTLAENACVPNGGLAANAVAHGQSTESARQLLEANLGQAVTSSDFSISFGDDDCGPVTVTYVGEAQTTFAGAVGASELNVLSSSTAVTENHVVVGNLRPVSACKTHPAVQYFLDASDQPLDPAPPAMLTQVVVDKTWKNGDDCGGGASGNFGWLCFVGKCSAGQGAGDLPALIQNGYDGGLDLGDSGTDADNDCDPTTAAFESCTVEPGNIASLASDFEALECADPLDTSGCLTFSILVTDSHDGSGQNAEVHPWAFLYVQLIESCSAKPSDGGCPGYQHLGVGGATGSANRTTLVFKVLGLQRGGTPDGSALGGAPLGRLCDVDHNPGSSFC